MAGWTLDGCATALGVLQLKPAGTKWEPLEPLNHWESTATQATGVSADANSRPAHATHTPPSPELTRTGHRNPPTPLLHMKETRRSNTSLSR